MQTGADTTMQPFHQIELQCKPRTDLPDGAPTFSDVLAEIHQTWGKISGRDLLGLLDTVMVREHLYEAPLVPRYTMQEILVITSDGTVPPTVYNMHHVPGRETLGDLDARLKAKLQIRHDQGDVLVWKYLLKKNGTLRAGLYEPLLSLENTLPYGGAASDQRVLTAWRVRSNQSQKYVQCNVLETFEVPYLLPIILPLPPMNAAPSDETCRRVISGVLTEAIKPFFEGGAAGNIDPSSIIFDPVCHQQQHPIVPRPHLAACVRVYVRGQEAAPYDAFSLKADESAATASVLRQECTDVEIQREAVNFINSRHAIRILRFYLENYKDYTYSISVHTEKERLEYPLRLSVKCYHSGAHRNRLDHFYKFSHIISHVHRWMVGMKLMQKLWYVNTNDILSSAWSLQPNAPLACNGDIKLNITLLHHQSQNLHAMLRLEKDTESMLHKVMPPLNEHGMHYFPPTYSIFKWPCRHLGLTVRGGFLCDGTGMGKTVSMIALVASNGRQGITTTTTTTTSRATLVICPPSILGQWEREVRWACPRLSVCQYHADKRKNITKNALLTEYDIVLTTSRTYFLAFDLIGDIEWHRVVFDESHTIISDRLSKSPPKASLRWCISATPMHNLNRQICALTLQPYPTNLITDVHMPPEAVYYIMKPLTVSHTKSTADLPPLIERDVPLTMEAGERRTYLTALGIIQRHFSHMQYSSMTMIQLHSLLYPLRSICYGQAWNRVSLVSYYTNAATTEVANGEDEGECPICYNVYDEPCVTTCGHWFCLCCLHEALSKSGSKCPICRNPQQTTDIKLGVVTDDDASNATQTQSLSSIKMASIIGMIIDLRDEDSSAKSLVFAPSKAVISQLRNLLATVGINTACIHGSMPSQQRTKAISTFQEDRNVRVMLLTLRSAACGINLTAANNIFFVTPGLNQAQKMQAVGRVWRQGQNRQVNVHNLFIRETVEEEMLKLTRRVEKWSTKHALKILETCMYKHSTCSMQS
jgi:SWI/SNF-related matrix-associated actin-dependent regulator of chromatin subfamily A3